MASVIDSYAIMGCGVLAMEEKKNLPTTEWIWLKGF